METYKKMRELKKAKRYQVPCMVDGKRFDTITEAWQYLQEVSGRVHLDRLERHIRQGRKVTEGHVISKLTG